MARPPAGPKHARKLDLSEIAKKRTEVILENLAGQKTVDEACEELGIKRAYFHQLRDRFLMEGGQGLEPGVPGRPRRRTDPKDEKIAELETKLAQTEVELRAAEIRAELAVAMPQVLQDEQAKKKKKGSQLESRLRRPWRGRKRRKP